MHIYCWQIKCEFIYYVTDFIIYAWKPTNASINIQFISYVWWPLHVSALYCHPQGAFIEPSETCSIEVQSIKYYRWVCCDLDHHAPRHQTQHTPVVLPSGKDPVPILWEAGWAPGPVWTVVGRVRPTGIRSLDRPVSTGSLFQIRYPGPI
jgi:hypothetical protein